MVSERLAGIGGRKEVSAKDFVIAVEGFCIFSYVAFALHCENAGMEPVLYLCFSSFLFVMLHSLPVTSLKSEHALCRKQNFVHHT